MNHHKNRSWVEKYVDGGKVVNVGPDGNGCISVGLVGMLFCSEVLNLVVWGFVIKGAPFFIYKFALRLTTRYSLKLAIFHLGETGVSKKQLEHQN